MFIDQCDRSQHMAIVATDIQSAGATERVANMFARTIQHHDIQNMSMRVVDPLTHSLKPGIKYDA